MRGVGGTRNCDWWLTNEAVILDTAGRYTTEDDDRDEWLAFLDTLTKHRPKRPINGLIVAVSVSELMGADPQVAGELGTEHPRARGRGHGAAADARARVRDVHQVRSASPGFVGDVRRT